MTQIKIAEQAGISRKAILEAESKDTIQFDTLMAIMQALPLS
jgi:DNA-binding phage protein